MELFWKTIGIAMTVVMLSLFLGERGKLYVLLVGIAGCVLVASVAATFLNPVMDFLRELEKAGALNSDMVIILLKAVGIGIVTEGASLVSAECGQQSMGKAIQLLGSVTILWLSIPLFRILMDLIQHILGGI